MTSDTILIVAGIITTALTLLAYRALWPRNQVAHPLLRTRLEPFIMVALVSGLVLGSGMFFSGLVPG